MIAEFGVDPEAGLDAAQVRRRLREHGRNKLAEHRQRRTWEILVDQVKSLVAALLLLAALISSGFGEIVQGISILIALLLNVGIGFFAELRATFSLARLLHTLNMREPETPLLEDPVVTNRYVWGAIGIGVVLLLAALYVPYVSDALQTVDPGPDGWVLIVIGSVVPLIVGQLTKLRAVRRLAARVG